MNTERRDYRLTPCMLCKKRKRMFWGHLTLAIHFICDPCMAKERRK